MHNNPGNFTGCTKAIISSATYAGLPYFPATNVFSESQDSWVGSVANYWLSVDGKSGPDQQFTIDLGCLQAVSLARLINTHNAFHRDSATKQFRYPS